MHRITFYPRSLCLASTLDCHFLSVNWHRLYFLMPNASITYRAGLERINCKNNFFGVSLKQKNWETIYDKSISSSKSIHNARYSTNNRLQYYPPNKVAIFVNCTEYSHVLQYCTYTGHIRVFELRYKNCFNLFFKNTDKYVAIFELPFKCRTEVVSTLRAKNTGIRTCVTDGNSQTDCVYLRLILGSNQLENGFVQRKD